MLGLLLGLCGLVLFLSDAIAAGESPTGWLGDLPRQLQTDRLGPGENFRITRLVEDEDQSALLVQVRGSLPLHFHRRTREVVYLLEGEGILQLDGENIPIRPGAVARILPGQVHTFTNQGATPAVFLVVTAPRFDEKDRIMVEAVDVPH